MLGGRGSGGESVDNVANDAQCDKHANSDGDLYALAKFGKFAGEIVHFLPFK